METVTYLHGLGLVAQSDGTTTEYFASDGLGSVRQVMDEAGSPLLTQTFDPYGSLYARTGEDVTSFGFTGEYGDTNGLLYLRARYYAPSQGRFLQLDPSRQEVNPYSYAADAPTNFTDPSGLIPNPAASTDAQDAYQIITSLMRNYNVLVEIDFGWTGVGSRPFVPYSPVFPLSRLNSCGTWQEGKWELSHIEDIETALAKITEAVMRAASSSGASITNAVATQRVRDTFGGTIIRASHSKGSHAFFPYTVVIGESWLAAEPGNRLGFQHTIVHELGHMWDKRSGIKHDRAIGWTFGLSHGLGLAVGRLDPHCKDFTESSCFTSGEARQAIMRQLLVGRSITQPEDAQDTHLRWKILLTVLLNIQCHTMAHR